MKFLCDHMLGSLAKWLRFLGYDVMYPEALADGALKSAAEEDGRVLLTRDRELSGRVAGSLFVSSDDLDEQILLTLRTFQLGTQDVMTRCSVCNTPLRGIEKSEVAGKVPEGVLERQAEFWKCDGCGRHYWQGTHWERMTARIRDLQERAAKG